MAHISNMMTVKLENGSTIRFPQAVLNAGSAGATLQFGTISEVVQFVPAEPMIDSVMKAEKPAAEGIKLSSDSNLTTEMAQLNIKKGSVFSRLTRTTPTMLDEKERVVGPRLKSVIVKSPYSLDDPNVPKAVSFAPGQYDNEASSSGTKMNRKARRKYYAQCRATGIPVRYEQNVEPLVEANIPTANDFEPLKWVEMNSSEGTLKKSFWKAQSAVPKQPKREENLSSKIYKVLKAVKNRNLQRRIKNLVRQATDHDNDYPRSGRNTRKHNTYNEGSSRSRGLRVGGHQQRAPPTNANWLAGGSRRPPQRKPYIPAHIRSSDGNRGVRTKKRFQKFADRKSHAVWIPKKHHIAEVEEVQQETTQFEEEGDESPIINWKRRSEKHAPPKDNADDQLYFEDDDLMIEGELDLGDLHFDDKDDMEVEVVRMVDHTPPPPIQFVYSRSRIRGAVPEPQNEDPHQEGTSHQAPEHDARMEFEEAEMMTEVAERLRQRR